MALCGEHACLTVCGRTGGGRESAGEGRGRGRRAPGGSWRGANHFGTHWALADADGPWCAALREALRDI